jgi:hypothetical protein
MNSRHQELGFFVEDAFQTPLSQQAERSPRARSPLPWVALPPDGLAYLVSASPVELRPIPDVSVVDPGAIVVDTADYAQRPYLVLLAPAVGRVRLNGARVGRLSVLHIGDVLQLDDRHVLHVSALYRPFIGPPPSELLGIECLSCRVPFSADRTVYVCPSCGAALHCDGEDKPPEDRLQCALVTTACPRCGQAVARTEAFAYLPEVA